MRLPLVAAALRWVRVWLVLAIPLCAAQTDAASRKAAHDRNDRIVIMEAFRVETTPLENFGFQVDGPSSRLGSPLIIAVLPNTAAAKAGLRPGDAIFTSDGVLVMRPRAYGLTVTARNGKRMSLPPEQQPDNWEGFYVPPEKRAAVQNGEPVSWTLEVRSHESSAKPRTVTLTLPTSPPRWGGKVWAPPEGRSPATVPEPGPLALRAKEILDNGIWIMARDDLARNVVRRTYYYAFQWWIGHDRSITVSQVRGRTDIVLQHGITYYLTSPSGTLERAMRNEFVPAFDDWVELPRADAQKAFQREVDFWLNRVGKVSDRWPLEEKR